MRSYEKKSFALNRFLGATFDFPSPETQGNGLEMTVQTNARTGPTSDNARGCLLGLAVGDVLGCPIEAMAPSKIREKFGKVKDLVETPVGDLRDTYFWRLSGLHCDDTQQALAICRTW